MPRHSSGDDKLLDGNYTIQKRVRSSPSLLNPPLKNHCFKRTILVAKKRAPSTPVPSWRVCSRSPRYAAGFSESSQQLLYGDGSEETRDSVSARKLCNALWILNNTPPQALKDLQDIRSVKEVRRDKTSGHIRQTSFSHRDRAQAPLPDLCNQSRAISHKRKLSLTHHKFRIKEQDHVAPDSMNKVDLMKMGSFQGLDSTSSLLGSKKCFKDLRNGLVTSKELVEMLINFCGLHKQQISSASLVRALYCHLDKTLVLVDQLIQEINSGHSELCCLLRQFEKEEETWKNKKQAGNQVGARFVIEEIETERKLRRRAEIKNEKLKKKLAKMKTSLVNASKELESEKQTREVVEQVCSQMIRGIGDDKAEVEELKRESVIAREELETERQMLQLADEWREERVQMKLTEAKHQFEEKNAAVDQLRCELEAFLAAKTAPDPVKGPRDHSHDVESDCLGKMHPSRIISTTNLIMDRRDIGGEKYYEENEPTDSEESDLHSIELDMDTGNNGYCWGHASAAIDKKGELPLTSENPETSTNLEKVSGAEGKAITEGIKENFARKFRSLDERVEEGRLADNSGRLDQSRERFNGCSTMEVLEDHNLAGSSIILPRGPPSSRRQSGRQEVLQTKAEKVCLGSKVSEMVKAIRESESMAGLGRTSKLHSQLQIAPIQ